MDSRMKYKRSYEISHRFTARSAKVGADIFNRMLSVSKRLTESSKQNNFEQFERQFERGFKEASREVSLITNLILPTLDLT